MSSLERTFQMLQAPDRGYGPSDPDPLTPKEPSQKVDAGAFLELVAIESVDPGLLYDFETKLRDSGFLSRLEEIGIVPSMPQNPNPHSDVEAHFLWALGHQEEMEKFMQQVERRQEILRYLYIGGIVGALIRL